MSDFALRLQEVHVQRGDFDLRVDSDERALSDGSAAWGGQVRARKVVVSGLVGDGTSTPEPTRALLRRLRAAAARQNARTLRRSSSSSSPRCSGREKRRFETQRPRQSTRATVSRSSFRTVSSRARGSSAVLHEEGRRFLCRSIRSAISRSSGRDSQVAM